MLLGRGPRWVKLPRRNGHQDVTGGGAPLKPVIGEQEKGAPDSLLIKKPLASSGTAWHLAGRSSHPLGLPPQVYQGLT